MANEHKERRGKKEDGRKKKKDGWSDVRMIDRL
jgi:hypothetical protein